MGLNRWICDITGIPGNHVWWCYQFDSAVSHLGRSIENLYEERNKQGERIHRLEDLVRSGTDSGDKKNKKEELLGFLASQGKGIQVDRG